MKNVVIMQAFLLPIFHSFLLLNRKKSESQIGVYLYIKLFVNFVVFKHFGFSIFIKLSRTNNNTEKGKKLKY